MALNVYNIEVRDGTVALRPTWLSFTIIEVHSLCKCVDTKHLATNHSPDTLSTSQPITAKTLFTKHLSTNHR